MVLPTRPEGTGIFIWGPKEQKKKGERKKHSVLKNSLPLQGEEGQKKKQRGTLNFRLKMKTILYELRPKRQVHLTPQKKGKKLKLKET